MKRTIQIATSGLHLRVRHGQLVVQKNGSDLGTVPLEDIGTLLLATEQCSVTGAVLSRVVEAGGVVVVCGRDHMPTGQLYGIRGHSTMGERLRHQVQASRPLQKSLWQSIVRQKVKNQAHLLPAGPARRRLLELAKSVRSGDGSGAEAQAGRVYWSALFADIPADVMEVPFRRRRDGPPPNNLLNYGYAVLRSCLVRAISGAGLSPGIGIQHSNRYNPFGLADDLMEPFRPFVDGIVLDLVRDRQLDLDRAVKERLLSVPHVGVRLGRNVTTLENAAIKTASSFAGCLQMASSKERPGVREIVKSLVLPSWND